MTEKQKSPEEIAATQEEAEEAARRETRRRQIAHQETERRRVEKVQADKDARRQQAEQEASELAGRRAGISRLSVRQPTGETGKHRPGGWNAAGRRSTAADHTTPGSSRVRCLCRRWSRRRRPESWWLGRKWGSSHLARKTSPGFSIPSSRVGLRHPACVFCSVTGGFSSPPGLSDDGGRAP